MITAIALFASTGALASSHREAPAISLDPSADSTDLYMFKSPTDATKLVLIHNVIPDESPGGGPNFYRFDDSVLYEINIDNEGDGEADIVYQWRFETEYTIPDTFLYNVGAVSNLANVNMQQTYSVTMVADGVSTTILSSGNVAPINVGTASVVQGTEYKPQSAAAGTLTTSNIETQGAYRFFSGPRQEGFYVDLENTFDLLNLGANGGAINSLLGKNVHTMAIEVPITNLTMDGAAATAVNENNVIAAWATTSRRAATIRRADGSGTASRGDWVQVSRLGNPLVNEVVINVAQKDVFNASHPRDDIQFLDRVQYPELVGLLNAILGTTCPTVYEGGLPTPFDGRDDLVLAFLTGHPAVGNQPAGFVLGGDIPAETSGKVYAAYEALRINLETPSGFPNGRMVGDDVTDTALSALCGLLIDGSELPDGVDSTGLVYLNAFPFLGDPWAGNDHPAGNHNP